MNEQNKSILEQDNMFQNKTLDNSLIQTDESSPQKVNFSKVKSQLLCLKKKQVTDRLLD